MDGEQWLLDWGSAASAGVEACGGKGWNLARLARYGFAVPDGGVLIARAYQSLLEQCLEAGEAERLQELKAASVTDETVTARLDALCQRILEAPLPEGVEAALAEFLVRQNLQAAPLAVRSSAIAEDGESHSFAGIHESVLNVSGLPNLIDAVRRCYASLWTPQAVAYRRHAGLHDSKCGCAVVICRMVGSPGDAVPVAAGVLFTCDPLSGRRDRLVINSVRGLAERMVAGAEVPEQITVTTALLRYEVTGRESPDRSSSSPLSDSVVLELARWGMRAHWAFGDGDLPQDIEWAYDGTRLWFLQTRPVTGIPHRTFDALASMPVIWSNANLKEVVSGVPTTLSWSLIQDAVRDMLFAPLCAAGFPIPEGMPILRRFRGRAYFDLSALQWAYFDGFGYAPAQLNRELGGKQPQMPVPPGDPMKGKGGRQRSRRQLRMLLALRGIGRRLTKAHEEALARVVAFREVPLEGMTDVQLRALQQEWHAYGIALIHLSHFGNSDAGVWLKFARDLLTWLDPREGESLLGRLLAAGDNMPSTEALRKLHGLARIGAVDPDARPWLEALQGREPEGEKRNWDELPTESSFRAAFFDYLRCYGHRALNETELANPRWHEDPDYLLREIASWLDVEDQPQAMARNRRREGELELQRLPIWSRPLVRWLAARARRGMALREIGKSLSIVTLEPERRIALEVGRRLASRGALQRPEQVFHFALADLDALLAGVWDGSGAQALAADREAQRRAWMRQAVGDVVITGDAARLQGPQTGDGDERATAWRGIGVSPGLASGKARVLHCPEEGARLGRGEILVAPTTDPGWTPLFLRAGGIVTEIGGYLSHGAIVARELGIPAVVNLAGASILLADEPEVSVDGGRGTVYPAAADREQHD